MVGIGLSRPVAPLPTAAHPHRYAEPVEGRLWFAGEAASLWDAPLVHGAYASGLFTAWDILAHRGQPLPARDGPAFTQYTERFLPCNAQACHSVDTKWEATHARARTHSNTQHNIQHNITHIFVYNAIYVCIEHIFYDVVCLCLQVYKCICTQVHLCFHACFL